MSNKQAPSSKSAGESVKTQPPYTAVRILYFDESHRLIRKAVLVRDAELIDEYGYIEAMITSTGITNDNQAQVRGRRLLNQVRRRFTATA